MSLDLHALLGDDADSLLGHSAKAFPSEGLVLPGPDYLSRVFTDSDRSPTVLRNLGTLFNHGRLGGTGYLSILPVDQGIEHSAAASFSKNPAYFDPANLVELALAGECNAVATTLGHARHGVAALRPPHPVHRQAQPQPVPALPEHLRPDHVRLGAARPSTSGPSGVGATIYFGSDDADRELQEVSRGLRRGPPPRDVHRAVVLPAQRGLHRRTG